MHRPKIFAHRGGRKWAPENTLSAFKKALEAGCDGIELDVQRCASGELVVIHDPDFSRTTNGVGLVKEATLAEVKRLDAGDWFGPEYKGERIPTLEEVLQLIDGKLEINIEIKNAPIEYENIEDDLISLLESYSHKDTLIISSFDHKFMRRFHALNTGLKTALLADCIMLDIKDYAAKIGAEFWHPCYGSLTESAIEEAHSVGLKVNAWTLNTVRMWNEAIKFKIDGIVTDDHEGLISFLQRMEAATARVS